MRPIKVFWQKLSLKRKVMILFSLLALIPVTVVSIFASAITNRYVHNLVSSSVRQTAETISSNLDRVFSEATSLFSLRQNMKLVNFLNSSGEDARYRSALELGIAYKDFRNANKVTPYVKDITILGTNGYVYSERDGAKTLDGKLIEMPEFISAARLPNRIHVLITPYTHNRNRQLANEVALTIGLLKLGTTEFYGVMQISIDSEYLYASLNDPRIPSGGGVIISDKNGDLLFSDQTSHQTLSKGVLMATNLAEDTTDISSTHKNILYASTMESTGWNVVVAVPQTYINEPANKINNVMLLGMLLALVLVVISLVVINTIIVTPTRTISQYMKQAAAGQLNITGGHPGQDEISALFNNYDVMINNIKALLQRIVEQQESVRQIELRVLQEQINPHFLYNSLDSVIWAAESENFEQVTKLTLSLSNFYRAALAGGLDIVTLENEFNLVRSFLEVMQMRYQDILDYEIKLDPQAASIAFPKIILEPIVENSIYHGIKQKRWKSGEKGIIYVSALLNTEGTLKIIIQDNGIGMSNERLTTVQASLTASKSDSHESYGLWNVNQRLTLYFQKAYSLSIESKPLEGTTVIIEISKQGKNQYA